MPNNEEITNFESIQRHAFAIMEMENCPEIVKDFLIRLVADQKSLVEATKAIQMLAISSLAFSQLMDRARNAVVLGTILQLLENNGDDNERDDENPLDSDTGR